MNYQTNVPPHDVLIMGQHYDEARNELLDIPKYELKAFRQLIAAQFADISKVIYIDYVDYEPYGENPTVEDMLQDFRQGVLKIHTTGNESDVWGKFYNLQFRAIHDFIHLTNELEFNHRNECITYSKQFEYSLQYYKQFPHLNWDTYRRVLRSEIVYQSAYKEAFGKFHIGQKIILKDL